MADWDWLLSSEAGRDRILRGEIEGLQASAWSARAQSTRLSSQLTQLQGSLETRLSALSAAFDAYVELGDVREQLAGYPDTSAIRRDAVAAVDVLSRGGVPERLDHRELDYWLSYAVNAVIALVGGTGDTEAEERAVQLSRDAELFMVAAAGALGAGGQVADRVAALLICDGTLTPRQLVVWNAVLADVFGPRLAAVAPVWVPAIDQAPDTWTAWVRISGRTVGAVGSLRWLDELTSPVDSPVDSPVNSQAGGPRRPAGRGVPATELQLSGNAATAADPRTGLRSLVVGLVGQGMGNESALLSRSRLLRAKIESPTAPDVEEPQDPSGSVTEVVQQALLEASQGSAVRRELLGWVSPGLVAAAAHFGRAAQVLPVAEVQVSTETGLVAVGPDGPDPQRLTRAETVVAERTEAPLRRVIAPAVVVGVLAVLALATAVTGHSRAALLLLLGALLAGVVLGYLVVERRRAAQQRGRMLEQLHVSLSEGQRDATQLRHDQQAVALDSARLAEQIGARLQGGQAG